MTAAEHRGYDRAIAEVVAVMRRNLTKPMRDKMWEACEDYFVGDQTTVDGMRLALGAIATAIEAGEHKP